MLGWTGDNGDPDNFFFLLRLRGGPAGGQNVAKWCNKEFEDLLQKAQDRRRRRPSAPSSTRRRR